MRTQTKPKRIPPIKVPKKRCARVAKARNGPGKGLIHGPNAEQVTSEFWGKFGSDRNIFEVDTQDNKQERPNAEEYRLTTWKVEGFRIGFEE